MQGLGLEGRNAVVTGGASGIGAAICRDLDALGARVGIMDLNEEGAAQVAGELGDAQAFHVDLADPTSIARAVESVRQGLGHVDVLINNAGWDKVGPFVDSDPAIWDRLIAINLRAPIQLTHAFLPEMMKGSWGRLVHVASDAARVGSTGEAVYSACKSGLVGFSKTIARESARAGVTSNVVCPGPSDTPLLHQIAEGNERLMESLKRAIPIGRLGQPEDVAGMVAYIASERAGFVTGQTVSVSGGLTMA